jgi:hypothetical protein
MSASARLAAASAVAASLFVFTPIAFAADLYEDGYGQAPRYERYAQPPADFEPPYPPRYTDGGPCVPRELVRDRLLSEGWGDFRDFDPRGRVILVQARRPSGRLFDLTIDRCSGQVVDARPVFAPRAERGAYAYGGYGGYGGYGYGPRRFWPRPY